MLPIKSLTTVRSMLISIIGSHGTGKTTLTNQLRKQSRRSWSIFRDFYRDSAKRLGYSRPRDILLEDCSQKPVAITAFTAAALGSLQQWLDSFSSGVTSENVGIIDLGPPSLLAYHRYWMAVSKMPVSPYLLNLCRQLTKRIDYFIYLPSDHFPVTEDPEQSADPIFQKDIDQWVKHCISELEIPEEKLLIVQSKETEERVAEVLAWLDQKKLTTSKSHKFF